MAVGGLDAGVRAIVAGDHNSVALRADGSVVGWGLGATGELGLENVPDRAVPTEGLERGIVAIAAGRYHQQFHPHDHADPWSRIAWL